MLKGIKGFPNYQVDENGNVYNKQLNRYEKQYANKYKGGYLGVSIKDENGKAIMKKVHRLVAEAFIPNPNNYQCVDHIDTNVLNNNVKNLRWCSIKMNNNNELTRKHNSEAQKGKHHSIETEFKKGVPNLSTSTKVMCLNNGKVYESQKEAAKDLKISPKHISDVCRGVRKKTHGYSFIYSNN